LYQYTDWPSDSKRCQELNLSRPGNQHYEDGNGNDREGIPMKMEGPVPVKHPTENTADHTEESAYHAKERSEYDPKYSPNNSKDATDNTDDNRECDDDQND
jgi:hypothetical protein